MCTLTINRTPQQLLVTMNRDELLTRAPESPPQRHSDGATTWVAPHDGEKGGTWMGANDHGVVACLLNFYLPGENLLPDRSGRYRSRGEVIPQLLSHGDFNTGVAWLQNRFAADAYPSFDLHVVGPERTLRFMWLRRNGLESEDTTAEWQIYSSSGWDSAEVTRWREQAFDDWLQAGGNLIDTLPAFHLLRKAGAEDFSPLMVREWSTTRSITQARVLYQSSRCELRYWPLPQPDSGPPAACIALPLLQAAEPRGK